MRVPKNRTAAQTLQHPSDFRLEDHRYSDYQRSQAVSEQPA